MFRSLILNLLTPIVLKLIHYKSTINNQQFERTFHECFKKKENLDFDDVHMSSKDHEKNGYGHNLDFQL
jgi:hypothetical protein